MSTANFGLVIVAGGAGTRMGGNTPKPLIKLAGREVLLHTLEAFAGFEWIAERIVVFPKTIIKELFGPEKQRNFPSAEAEHPLVVAMAELGVTECVCGGERRQDSVERGAKALTEVCEFVMVHDAVRPFVEAEDVEALAAAIRKGHAASLSTPVTDTLRRIDAAEKIDREALVAVQTPQGGKREALLRALQDSEDRPFSDDLSAFESVGEALALVSGAKSNIKLTTPEDLTFAEFLLRAKDA